MTDVDDLGDNNLTNDDIIMHMICGPKMDSKNLAGSSERNKNHGSELCESVTISGKEIRYTGDFDGASLKESFDYTTQSSANANKVDADPLEVKKRKQYNIRGNTTTNHDNAKATRKPILSKSKRSKLSKRNKHHAESYPYSHSLNDKEYNRHAHPTSYQRSRHQEIRSASSSLQTKKSSAGHSDESDIDFFVLSNISIEPSLGSSMQLDLKQVHNGLPKKNDKLKSHLQGGSWIGNKNLASPPSVPEDHMEISSSLRNTPSNVHYRKITEESYEPQINPFSALTDYDPNTDKLDVFSFDDSAILSTPLINLSTIKPLVRYETAGRSQDQQTLCIRDLNSPQFYIPCDADLDNYESKICSEEMKDQISNFEHRQQNPEVQPIQEQPMFSEKLKSIEKPKAAKNEIGDAFFVLLATPNDLEYMKGTNDNKIWPNPSMASFIEATKPRREEKRLESHQEMQKREANILSKRASNFDQISIGDLFEDKTSKVTLNQLKDPQNDVSIFIPVLQSTPPSQQASTASQSEGHSLLRKRSLQEPSPKLNNGEDALIILPDSMMELIAQNDEILDTLSLSSSSISHKFKDYGFETNDGLIKTLNSAFEIDDCLSIELKKYDDLIYSFANDFTASDKSTAGDAPKVVVTMTIDDDTSGSRSLRSPTTGNSVLSKKYDLFQQISAKFSSSLSVPDTISTKVIQDKSLVIEPNHAISLKSSLCKSPEISKLPNISLFPKATTATPREETIEFKAETNPNSTECSSNNFEVGSTFKLGSEQERKECNMSKSMASPTDKSILSPAGTVTAKLYEDIGINGLIEKLSSTRPKACHFVEDLSHRDSGYPVYRLSIPKETPINRKQTMKKVQLKLESHKCETNHLVEFINQSHHGEQNFFSNPTDSSTGVDSYATVNTRKVRKTFRDIFFSSRFERHNIDRTKHKLFIEEKPSNILCWSRSLFSNRSSSDKKCSSVLILKSSESVGEGFSLASDGKKGDSNMNEFISTISDRPISREYNYFSDSEDESIEEKLIQDYERSSFLVTVPMRQNLMFAEGRAIPFKTLSNTTNKLSKLRLENMSLMVTDEPIESKRRLPTIRFSESPEYLVEEKPELESSHRDKFNKRNKTSLDLKNVFIRKTSNSSLLGSLNIKTFFPSSNEVKVDKYSETPETGNFKSLSRNRSLRLLRKLSIFKQQKDN